MGRYPQRSLSTPIVLASIAVVLTITLLVGWILLLVDNWDRMSTTLGVSLLVAGIVSLLFLTVAPILFGVFLVREILEVRRQTSFIDSVTHELKSPLASLRLGLETLRRADLSAEQRQNVQGMMTSDIDRLGSFIEDILIASRLAYERRGHEMRDVELLPLVEHCVDSLRQRHQLPAAAVRLAIPKDLRWPTDPTAMETIVKNLLDNAIKYSNSPIDVQVFAERKNGLVRLEVRDRGIGLDPRQKKRIFERFYRVPDEAVRQRRGTGLGLFVAHTLARNLGGELRAESEGLGRGTTFIVELPATRPAPPSPRDLDANAESARR